jgi:hypothetical protein
VRLALDTERPPVKGPKPRWPPGLGTSGSLGSNAGGHALSRALGLSCTRDFDYSLAGRPSAMSLCLANHASLQILISTCPKLAPAVSCFSAHSYDQRTVEKQVSNVAAITDLAP